MKRLLTATAVAALMMSSALAQTTTPSQSTFIPAQKADDLQASRLLGTNVYGPDNAKVGDISEILIDRSGSVHTVVIGVGGFLGIGEKDVAIPFKELSIARTASGDGREKITVRYTKEQFIQAPKFVPMASVDLTTEQRRSVYAIVMKEKVKTPPPADWRASVGADVPRSVELYDLPAAVAAPAAKSYRYTVAGNQVVLVDASRKVVHVLTQ